MYQKHIVFVLNILFTHNINTYPQISILANEAAYNHLQQRQISIKYKIIVSFQMSKIVDSYKHIYIFICQCVTRALHQFYTKQYTSKAR